jgi:hypothetical protein
MADMEELRRDRELLQYVLTLDMSPDYRSIFAALLADLEKQICELEPRPTN